MDIFIDYGYIIVCRSDLGLYKRIRCNLIGCDWFNCLKYCFYISKIFVVYEYVIDNFKMFM